MNLSPALLLTNNLRLLYFSHTPLAALSALVSTFSVRYMYLFYARRITLPFLKYDFARSGHPVRGAHADSARHRESAPRRAPYLSGRLVQGSGCYVFTASLVLRVNGTARHRDSEAAFSFASAV